MRRLIAKAVLGEEDKGYEAEKAADINVVDIRMTGAFGRVYLGGAQRDIDVASGAAQEAIESVTGRVKEGK